MTQNTTQITSLERVIKMLKEDMFKDIASALPEDVNPEKFIGVLSVNIEPKISDAIVQDKLTEASFRRSVTAAASDGLLLDGREAVLSPANKNFGNYQQKDYHVVVNYMPMAYGLTQLCFRAGISIRANVVYSADRFEYQLGDEEKIVHVPGDGDRGKLTKVYAIARVTGYPEPFREVMGASDIDSIKKASKTVKKDASKNIMKNPDGTIMMSGPWASFESEMWRKSVIRRIIKRLPRTANMSMLDGALKADDAFYNLSKDNAQAQDETQQKAQPVADGRPAGLGKLTGGSSPAEAAQVSPAQHAQTQAPQKDSVPSTGGPSATPPVSDESWEDPF